MSEQQPLSEIGRQSLQAAYEREVAKYQRVIRIAHMAFGEIDTPARPMSHTASTAETPRERFATLPRTVFLPKVMSLAEAQSRMPFTIALPAWVPDGFTFVDEGQAVLPEEQEVELHDTEGKVVGRHTIKNTPSVHLRWQREDQQGFSLGIDEVTLPPADLPVFPIAIAPDGVREVHVSGTPAALITGMFAMRVDNQDWANAQWMLDDTQTLRWAWGNVQYSLMAKPDVVSADDMLRIANSIPTP